ncbi:hypothetical protein CVT24_006915 [Panaeolus cyanescens]|uniref:Uncharacterized protein n=1 Tax=Panaeolus cyanescens TaxID=181874 RepID=A0A409VK08_9AGAR|nr:hypothetical protein CVT24_006915 [Panaeolus cyanescens]
MLNHQQRETSRSPSHRERPRALKGQSMPMIPSLNSLAGQTSQTQSSPTIPNASVRRSPPIGQVTRLLPTPPHPNPPNFQDLPDRHMSPPPVTQQSQQQPLGSSNPNAGYSRTLPRATRVPNMFQEMEDHFQMTPELLADIERADQQAQYHQATQHHSYPIGNRVESPPPSARDQGIERVRNGTERTSPTNPETVQQRRSRDQQTLARESPMSRDRQPTSPNMSAFPPPQIPTPERRVSPIQHTPILKPGEPHPASYLAQYNARESPTIRRAPVSEPRISAQMATQTPPQPVHNRAPDRSLPFQEEPEEEVSKNGAPSRDSWQSNDRSPESHPLPPDVNEDGDTPIYDNGGRINHSPRRDDETGVNKGDEGPPQYAGRDSTEEEDSFTPRSPTAPLPEETYPNNNNQPHPVRVPAPVPVRPKGRNGTSDQLMRGIENALLEDSSPPSVPPVAPSHPQQSQQQPPQQAQHQPEARRPPQPSPFQYPNGKHLYDDLGYAHFRDQNGFILPNDDPYGYGDDLTAAYIQHYMQSPRPDAPVPPTPQTATAAPSPSPMLAGYNPAAREAAAFMASRTAGSPYPHPFQHVRRIQQPQASRVFPGVTVDRAGITDQVARQWQVFAQNNHGDMSDTTSMSLSPSSTPMMENMYNHWAYHHTNRLLRNMRENMMDNISMTSSPSHQPVDLPLPPTFMPRKKNRRSTNGHLHQSYTRKPPPRVESTQPRETSPELSSSGEETSTAGEERPASRPVSAQEATLVEPIPVPIMPMPIPIVMTNSQDSDDNGEWVDEEDDGDYEDLLELEYHPSFVKNVTKRRRKWEVGWENLIQAFQALDRQTDATMILLASPSHTTKLHALHSRSIRRQPLITNSASMKELKRSFGAVAAQRRATRREKSPVMDRLMASSGSSTGDGSDGSSTLTEGNLRRALELALDSLQTMGQVYDDREARVLEELKRSRDDRERLELLLKQIVGDKNIMANGSPRP